jgi:hypothetical protein
VVERTLSHEQGNVALHQSENLYTVMVGIRATLRRLVLALHAESIRLSSHTNPNFRIPWEDALLQAFDEIGHLVNETSPEVYEDNPLPPDYEPPL